MTGWVAPSARANAVAQQNWQRATGAALVLLLHALLLMAALRAITHPGTQVRAEHELLFVLPSLRKPPPRATVTAPPAPPAPRGITLVLPVTPPPLATPTPDIKGLGQNLFGCAPETLGNLSSEQRARCGGIVPGVEGLGLGQARSHVKDPELRAAEMEKMNTPMSVPCVTIQTQSLGPAYQQHILMVDPVCANEQLNR
jgi:hypothetical protein